MISLKLTVYSVQYNSNVLNWLPLLSQFSPVHISALTADGSSSMLSVMCQQVMDLWYFHTEAQDTQICT